MSNLTKEQAIDLIEKAFESARQASQKKYQEIGGDQLMCGFAWTTIKPGTSRIARLLKERYDAHKDYYGGISVWNPGGLNVQNIDIKEAGARAFAEILQSNGVKAYHYSRLD